MGKSAEEILDKHYEVYRNLESNPAIPLLAKGMIVKAMKEFAEQFKNFGEKYKDIPLKKRVEPLPVDGYREALLKIEAMQLTPSESEQHNYKYAFNRCWHLAHDALNAAASASPPQEQGEKQEQK